MFLEDRATTADVPSRHDAYTSLKDWLVNATAFVPPIALAKASNPKSNWLLASMPEAARQRLLPFLELVEMPMGKVLSESGDCLRHVYFPTTAVVSLLYVMENGATGEVAVIGNDGLVGLSLLMGSDSTPNRAVVQTAGLGFRLNAQIIKSEFNRAGPVLALLLKYTQALITQTAQTAMCNRYHAVDQQLCRRLLQNLDLQCGNEIVITQERIAGMLGVRREGVTAAALRLQELALISYTRGRISVLDRDGLEKRSCECYAVVKNEYQRLLPAQETASNTALTGAVRYRPASQGLHFLTNAAA
jgi:CRP-like cAMP-binding protein